MNERLRRILETHRAALLEEWVRALEEGPLATRDLRSPEELRRDTEDLYEILSNASDDPDEHESVLEAVSALGRARVDQGVDIRGTTAFIQSLRAPLLRRILDSVPEGQLELVLAAAAFVDEILGRTVTAYVTARDEVIARQQEDLLELSTPVVKIWDGILAMPLVGTLDSRRAVAVMDGLLRAIADSGSSIAILDITGVSTVDTLVAQHLMRTVAAARLMGAECVISGIRPGIAQTLVELGVDLGEVATRSTLAHALADAMARNRRDGLDTEIPR